MKSAQINVDYTPLICRDISTSPRPPPLDRILQNLIGSKIAMCSTKFVVFFVGQSEIQDGHPDGWLAENVRLLLCNRWAEFNETWHEARSQCTLPSLWGFFSGRSDIQDGHPGIWLAETFSTSPLPQLNRIQRNLTGRKQDLTFLYQVFVFRSFGIPR